jgi:nitroimidazol reductase NimA-like FMN-containing flavoprotein (pyridoxamine 5'-phosphate oxidase superfamily)
MDERSEAMTTNKPVAELDPRFSGADATARPWSEAIAHLEKAEVFWLSTVRPDGRPHVTPLLALWLDGALYFSTGPTERKAKNIAQNAQCILTTGCNALDDGFDLVVEGKAVRVTDEARLQRVADLYESKYGSGWRYAVRDEAIYHAPEGSGSADDSPAFVYEVAPTTAFGFGKGAPFSQTRWRF